MSDADLAQSIQLIQINAPPVESANTDVRGSGDYDMNDKDNRSAMAVWCVQRAKADPQNSVKWFGLAKRWRDLAHAENSWRLQKTGAQQVMRVGPMAMQPNASRNPAQQQG